MPKMGFISLKDSIFSSTFQKVFNYVEAFPKLRGPFDLRPKVITMLHVCMYLAFKSLNHRSLEPFSIFEIHLVKRHWFIIYVLIIPKPP
jgi:hypothetical protein